MPVLANTRHERFAQLLASGKTADEAYSEAGYSANRGNATTLKAKQSVRDRVAEMQSKAAARTEITIDKLTDMLTADRELARELGQASAAVSAVEKIGRLHGFFVERTENLNLNVDVTDEPATEDDWAAEHQPH